MEMATADNTGQYDKWKEYELKSCEASLIHSLSDIKQAAAWSPSSV